MMVAIHCLVILFAVLTKITMGLTGDLDSDSIIAFIMLMLSMIVIGSAAIFTMVFVGYRFYKSVFTDQGYLTNTLPVTQRQIITAKGIVGVIWLVINFVIIAAAIMFMVISRDNFGDICLTLREVIDGLMAQGMSLTFVLTLTSLIISPFATVLQLYFCVAVGNLFTGHKVLGAIAAYAATYTVQQIIGLMILLGSGFQMVVSTVENTQNSVAYFDTMNVTMVASLMVTIIFTVVFYLGTNYIMTKKLNLQ